MQNAIYANSYTLKTGESIGPTTDNFTLIPHIGILQAGSTDQPAILLATLNLGYTVGGHSCTFIIETRLKSNQQDEVVIASTVFAGNLDINSTICLQGSYIIPKAGTDIDILFYWRIKGTANVVFLNEQTWSGAVFVSPVTTPGK